MARYNIANRIGSFCAKDDSSTHAHAQGFTVKANYCSGAVRRRQLNYPLYSNNICYRELSNRLKRQKIDTDVRSSINLAATARVQ